MRHRYEINPGLSPEEMSQAVQDADAELTREWEANPDRWLVLDQDPIEYPSLQEEFDQNYPEALNHPMIQQAQLNPEQMVLLQRLWMCRITDRSREKTNPVNPDPQKLARLLEQVQQQG